MADSSLPEIYQYALIKSVHMNQGYTYVCWFCSDFIKKSDVDDLRSLCQNIGVECRDISSRRWWFDLADLKKYGASISDEQKKRCFYTSLVDLLRLDPDNVSDIYADFDVLSNLKSAIPDDLEHQQMMNGKHPLLVSREDEETLTNSFLVKGEGYREFFDRVIKWEILPKLNDPSMKTKLLSPKSIECGAIAGPKFLAQLYASLSVNGSELPVCRQDHPAQQGNHNHFSYRKKEYKENIENPSNKIRQSILSIQNVYFEKKFFEISQKLNSTNKLEDKVALMRMKISYISRINQCMQQKLDTCKPK